VRLSDVAELADVSTATASRALNGEPTISVTTRERVERAAGKLAYHVNPMARALSLRRTSTIGFVVGDLTNPFFAQLARGVDAGLRDDGYSYLLADLAGDASRQRELVRQMVNRHVDGLLVTVPHDTTVMRRAGVPLVAIDRCDGVPYVSCDNVAGGRLAAEHLIASGYRRPGFLFAEPSITPVSDRRAGFRQGLAAAGHDLGPDEERQCTTLGYDDAYAGALELLRAGVDSVFCVDDVMAAAVIAAALELGLSVPGDVGVVGYDDTPMAGWRTLSLTSVDQRTMDLGRAAAQMILALIREPESPLASITLEPRLVVRESSRGPRARRPRRR
jgi:LacI family transcriptional regulator